MKRKVLVIDDNVDMCENIASIVKLANYQVLTANSGREGVKLAQQSMPDLIICDVMMPDLDGYGVLHILSKDPKTAEIPFIYVTAKSDQKDFRMGMNLGADDYIVKPFDGLELFNVIELRLKKNELIKTTFGNNVSEIDDFFVKAKQLPDFHQISDSRLSTTFRTRDVIYKEGGQPNFLYFISKGKVRTFKSTDEGKELTTGMHGEGEFIGFLPLLENRNNNETAVVLKDAELYLIPRQDFITMIYTNKAIARKFIAMLSNNLYKTEDQLIGLAYQSVRHRVATLLTMLNTTNDKNTTLITVARKDISSMIGTTIESLNRTLADFKAQGIIEISDHGLRILDAARLTMVRD